MRGALARRASGASGLGPLNPVRYAGTPVAAPSSSGLGRRPLTAVAWVRIPSGLQIAVNLHICPQLFSLGGCAPGLHACGLGAGSCALAPPPEFRRRLAVRPVSSYTAAIARVSCGWSSLSASSVLRCHPAQAETSRKAQRQLCQWPFCARTAWLSGRSQRERQPVSSRAVTGASRCDDRECSFARETSVAIGHEEVGPRRRDRGAVVAVEGVLAGGLPPGVGPVIVEQRRRIGVLRQLREPQPVRDTAGRDTGRCETGGLN